MSAVLPVIVVVFDLILPIALLLWALRSRAKSRLYLASILLSAAVIIAILAKSIVGFWHVVGVFWPAVYLVAFAVILILRAREGIPSAWLPRRWSREFFVTALNILHTGLWALMIPPLLQARSYEGTALSLASPLRGGEFYVTAGGANTSVNQHGDYALDIGRLNAFGLSAAGFFIRPLDPDGGDRMGGNHVVIFCDGHSVQLAHLQAGTVVVSVGHQVAIGQLVGKVGNSGNTMQPHLHINAARGRYLFVRSDDRVLTAAQTVPFLIDGAFLVKGDSFRN